MPQQGGCTCHVRTNRHSPYCQLIPREQITTKTEQKGEGQQDHSHGPVEFTGRFILGCIEGTCHMHHNHEDHSMRSITVHIAQYITEGHHVLQIFHVIKSSRNHWDIIKHEQDTSKC